jgi:predicted ATP-dependent serine protease
MAGKSKQRILRDQQAEARKVCDARGHHLVKWAPWGKCMECGKWLKPEDRIGVADSAQASQPLARQTSLVAMDQPTAAA